MGEHTPCGGWRRNNYLRLLSAPLDKAVEVVFYDQAAAHAKPAQRPLVLVRHLRRPGEIERALTVVENRRLDHLRVDPAASALPVLWDRSLIGQRIERAYA